jgi:hypothetical protein
MPVQPAILKKSKNMSRAKEACTSALLASEISSKMNFLKEKGLWEHSVDFSLQRLGRQPKLPDKDPQYIQTALNNYMDFHDQLGVRIPIHARNSSATLSSEYAKLEQSA